MAQQSISMPSSFGGLMRYNEEYESPMKFSPEVVILFLILIIVFISVLKIFWPITSV